MELIRRQKFWQMEIKIPVLTRRGALEVVVKCVAARGGASDGIPSPHPVDGSSVNAELVLLHPPAKFTTQVAVPPLR